jgi:hypothetical protein
LIEKVPDGIGRRFTLGKPDIGERAERARDVLARR